MKNELVAILLGGGGGGGGGGGVEGKTQYFEMYKLLQGWLEWYC